MRIISERKEEDRTERHRTFLNGEEYYIKNGKMDVSKRRMDGIERFINLDGLELRKRQLPEHGRPRIVVGHDEVEVHGKGIVQRLIEKYRT